MLVRQLAGRYAGQIVEMAFAEAQANLAAGTVALPDAAAEPPSLDPRAALPPPMSQPVPPAAEPPSLDPRASRAAAEPPSLDPRAAAEPAEASGAAVGKPRGFGRRKASRKSSEGGLSAR